MSRFNPFSIFWFSFTLAVAFWASVWWISGTGPSETDLVVQPDDGSVRALAGAGAQAGLMGGLASDPMGLESTAWTAFWTAVSKPFEALSEAGNPVVHTTSTELTIFLSPEVVQEANFLYANPVDAPLSARAERTEPISGNSDVVRSETPDW